MPKRRFRPKYPVPPLVDLPVISNKTPDEEGTDSCVVKTASLTPQAIQAIVAILHESTGMQFSEGRTGIVRRRIEERMTLLKMEQWPQYRNLLTEDVHELSRLIEAVAVNETFFFRHPAQFELFRRAILPALLNSSAGRAARVPNAPLRLWSAGCANGCEPYSLAITCLEAEQIFGPFAWEVIATDIDSIAIEEGGRACFTEREVSLEMSEEVRDRYFERKECGRWMLLPIVRDHVRFHRLNLVKDVLPAECDVVFCRNVLYYFSNAVQTDVLKKIWRSLRTGGFLFLGPSEPCSRLECYFRVADVDERVMEAWSTDRRKEENFSNSTAFFERRASTGAPVILEGRGERLVLAGVLSSASDLQSFQRSLLFELSNLEKQAWLDCRDLLWISNDALHELRIVIQESVILRRIRINGALFANATVADWFAQAGYASLIGKIEVPGLVTGTPPGVPVRPSAPPVSGIPSSPRLTPQPAEREMPCKPGSDGVGSSARPPGRPIVFSEIPAMGEARVVRFPEIADEAYLPELRAALFEALAGGAAMRRDAQHPTEVILDLGKCRFLDERAAVIVGRAARSRRDNQRLVLRAPTPSVERCLSRILSNDIGVIWHLESRKPVQR